MEGDNLDSVSIASVLPIDTIIKRNNLNKNSELIVGTVLKTNNENEAIAKRAGLPKDVTIDTFNGVNVSSLADLKRLFHLNKGKVVSLGFSFENKRRGNISVRIPNEDVPKIGFLTKDYSEVLGSQNMEYSLFGGESPSCIGAGISETTKSIRQYVGQLPLIFLPETGVYKEVGGFIKIGQIFPSEFDWKKFWILTALLSIMLAVINLLPIPALDGGHATILLFEMITGKDLNPKILERLQIIGMIILFALFIYANGLDIWNLFK